MNYQICAILLVVLLASHCSANFLVDGIGTDIISGYLLSPVFGPSKIFLTKKSRGKAILHAMPIKAPVPLSGVYPLPFAYGLPMPMPSGQLPIFKSPITDDYFKIEEDEDILRK